MAPFDLDLTRVEEEALKNPDDLMSAYVQKLVFRVRELDHELANPNYLFAQGRISRQALVIRNQEIEKLRSQIRDLTKGMKCERPPEGWHCTRQPGHSGPCAAVPK
jgi:hypothetical protein